MAKDADSRGNRAALCALSAGLAGALAAGQLGLPAAALIGASLAVSGAAWAGLAVRMPPGLRDAGFLGIGLTLGSGIEPDSFALLGDWAVSLILLILSLVAIIAAGARLLRSRFGCDGGTAVLASSPGALSYALAMAESGGANLTSVLTIQSLRLLLLATVLPVAVWLFVGEIAPVPRTVTSWPALAGLAAAAAALGGVLARHGVPAAWLIGGFAASAAGHASGLASGMLPEWLAFLCFALIGATIGTHFAGLSRAALLNHLRAALAVTALSLGISLGFAALASGLTGLGLGQIWIAYAPGGVEAMAAIGLALGYDPAFVALHHLTRIAVLMALVPLFLHRRAGPAAR